MLAFKRYFTNKDKHAYDQINWVQASSVIRDAQNNLIWEQKDIEVPDFWSQTAIDIASFKYFYRAIPETSVKQLITRITSTIRTFGEQQNYFEDSESSQIFEEELTYLLVNQYAAFNSPVWFNCGLWHHNQIKSTNSQRHYYYDLKENKVKRSCYTYEYPQNSACFIQSVDDNLESMMALQQSEVSLFKFGSGSGTNFSKIRGNGELLSSGGASSGVLSFLEGFDRWAGSIKSGGTTRRSAKMVLLDIDHPEIIEFIDWKAKEEEKAKALIRQGYDSRFTGEAYKTVSGQNSNNSVRLTDDFMYAVETDINYSTKTRTTNLVHETYPAKELLEKIATAAWKCADPGIQFTDTINKWHTCKATGPINASNPCSEYLFLDDSACNLASLNLLKFVKDNQLELVKFRSAIRTFIVAMDIIVDLSSYPTEKIAKNSHDYRPLGLGYANLGGLLMQTGIPYDSTQARHYAGAITSLLSAEAYQTSLELAFSKGTFEGYKKNSESMSEVLNMHYSASKDLQKEITQESLDSKKKTKDSLFQHSFQEETKRLVTYATNTWKKCASPENIIGFRNSQISVIAPTGTIGLLMDCATTGVEPEFSLVKYKQLASGGQMTMINPLTKQSLKTLGYDNPKTLDYIIANNTVIDAPNLPKKYYPIFDCAVGNRCLSPEAHLLMVAAIQPFISGSISKTVNLPNTASVQDIQDLYFKAWSKGLKCVSVYRDGCKASQPLNTVSETSLKTNALVSREKLPDTRKSIAHKFNVGGQRCYMHIGFYDDGRPGEIFLRTSREGSTIKGLLDSIAILISLNLQHGVPLKSIVDKLRYGRFEPFGFTGNPEIPQASSLLDYIGQYLEKYLYQDEKEALEVPTIPAIKDTIDQSKSTGLELSGQICVGCGMQMIISGSCYFCQNCGNSSGCS